MSRDPKPAQQRFDCRVCLLGGFAVSINRRNVRLPSDAERLIAFLALQGERVPRSFVAGSLWSESSEERAFGNLRSALWRLRRVCDVLVESENQVLSIGSGVTVDVREATESARQLESGNDGGRELPPVEMFTDDLLPGWYDEWVLSDRERHRQRALHALEQLSARLSERGMHGSAIEAALAAIAREPLRESSHRQLIAVHLGEGNYSEAQRHYRLYRELLRNELGVRPSPILEELIGSEEARAPALAP